MATNGAKAASLLLGKAVKLSKIGVEQIPCVQVRCRENEFNSFLKMYFARSVDFWAIDQQHPAAAQQATTKSAAVELGDTVLIQPVESSKRPVSTVTHKVLRIVSKYGTVLDPITKKQVIENRFSDEWELRRKLGDENDEQPPLEKLNG